MLAVILGLALVFLGLNIGLLLLLALVLFLVFSAIVTWIGIRNKRGLGLGQNPRGVWELAAMANGIPPIIMAVLFLCIQQGAKFGEDQVKIWRRSYDIPPPELAADDERFPGRDPRYCGLTKAELPLTECLKDTVAPGPWRDETIAPAIRAGQKVIIAAHGNSLRAL